MRRWVLLTALLALLLAVAWWFLLIVPRNSRISDAHDELAAAQQREVSLLTQISQLQTIRESEVEYLAGIGKMAALIPDQPLLDEFIEQIYALSESTGVALLNLAPATPVAVEGSELRAITVAVTIDGEFFEVLGFLFGVMDMDRLVRVDSILISSGQDELGLTTLSVTLNVRLFTLADLVPVATTVPESGSETPPEGGESPEAAPSEGTTTVPSAGATTTAPTGEG